MKIRHVNGTSDNKCKCGTWIQHWEKHNGGQSLPKYCSTKDCLGKDLVGSHVQRESTSDNKWYIVPLCGSCNSKGGEMEIADFVNFALANRQETCDK